VEHPSHGFRQAALSEQAGPEEKHGFEIGSADAILLAIAGLPNHSFGNRFVGFVSLGRGGIAVPKLNQPNSHTEAFQLPDAKRSHSSC
jgi:hypothetical protein